ncbi:unknown [Singapore grouper iridovirus]|uniref:Uncharacterized protein n=1 Tax=Singapore grouper iridovirus TaxID=262968 RepID=Q5YFK6_9VIRU|nr:hypothetical protein ORF059L [Singapore grouper iridovirus]AAS18074.1 unknown [Singapore grouper iridovirus]WAU86768.1 hypothetical protein ORF059L [Singapore grouper iridovirus]8HIF_y5 Chain y5, VP59 [Singapore grouper iridovirus]
MDSQGFWAILAFTPVLMILSLKGEGLLAMVGLLVLTVTLLASREKNDRPRLSCRGKIGRKVSGFENAGHVRDSHHVIYKRPPVNEYCAETREDNSLYVPEYCGQNWKNGVLSGMGTHHDAYRNLAVNMMTLRRESAVSAGWAHSYL